MPGGFSAAAQRDQTCVGVLSPLLRGAVSAVSCRWMSCNQGLRPGPRGFPLSAHSRIDGQEDGTGPRCHPCRSRRLPLLPCYWRGEDCRASLAMTCARNAGGWGQAPKSRMDHPSDRPSFFRPWRDWGCLLSLSPEMNPWAMISRPPGWAGLPESISAKCCFSMQQNSIAKRLYTKAGRWRRGLRLEPSQSQPPGSLARDLDDRQEDRAAKNARDASTDRACGPASLLPFFALLRSFRLKGFSAPLTAVRFVMFATTPEAAAFELMIDDSRLMIWVGRLRRHILISVYRQLAALRSQ